MTRIPKKRLSSLLFLPAVIFFAATVGFFVYAVSNPDFFTVLIFIFLIILPFLFFSRYQFITQQSETNLEKQDCIEKTNLLQAELEKENQIIMALRKKVVGYTQLKDLTEKLSLCLSLGDTSEMLCSQTDRLFGGREVTAILYLFESRTGQLGISSSQKGQMQVNIKSKKGDVFDSWVAKMFQPLLVEDAKTDFRFDIGKLRVDESHAIRSLISVPLLIGNKALGILRVDSPKENHFIIEDLRFLTTIGDIGVIAIENAQLYEHLEELAIKDSLTGLYLRRYLVERMKEEVGRELRRHKDLSFLMIDLDRFKDYNDKFGHTAGDIVLKTIGAVLTKTFNEPGMMVCRYGGEEFGVLLPECSKRQAVRLAEELRKQIENQEIILRKEKTRISVSIGVASFPEDAQFKEELMAKADQAMYKAKNQGRNRVCYF